MFKELTDSDIRLKMYQRNIEDIEEMMTPFGFTNDIDDEDNTFVEDGLRWKIVS
jgi:hypothetical protein